YEGEFEKLEKSNRTIYYANQEDDVFRTYAAYILNGKNSGAIEVIYNIDCQDEKEEICEKNKESDKERALKWIESVEFIKDRKSTRLNSSHVSISYAVFCLKKKKK